MSVYDAKPFKTTFAPAAVIASAILLPSPDTDPVTTAVLPFSISPNILKDIVII